MAGGGFPAALTAHSMNRSGISLVTVHRTRQSGTVITSWWSALVLGTSPRGRRSISMSNVWPTAVSGLEPGPPRSIPEPSMSM